jgi:hypothetical protein
MFLSHPVSYLLLLLLLDYADERITLEEFGVLFNQLDSATKQTVLRHFDQCCGSESGSTGSTCFWAPDPLVRGMDPDPDPSIFMQK